MNTYPRDEFDAVPESPRRQGVHRTRGESAPDSGWSAGGAAESGRSGRGLQWILAAGIIALVIGAVAFFVLPRLGLSGAPAAASSTSTTAGSSGGPSTPAGASSAAASQAPSSAAPSATPTPTAAGTADKSLPVGVYNATGTAGLGNRVAATVRTAGWSVSTVGNWAGSPVSAPVVYYRSAGDAATAKALAADAGISTVLEAPALGLPLAVVIGPGYAG
jgi:hypothetical protein